MLWHRGAFFVCAHNRVMRRFALTGGIGEGKSTVLAEFAALGVKTDSADAIARSVFEQADIQAALAEELGISGAVCPPILREAIARDESVRRQVNRIMHPRILEMINDSSAEIIEVPLLIETCMHGKFDGVIVATCGLREQRKRLMDRYENEELVDRLLSTQLPTRAKIPFATEIVRTDRPFKAVRDDATGVLTRLRLV